MDDKKINKEELIAAAKAHGVELTEDDLMDVSGGYQITRFSVGDNVVFHNERDDGPRILNGTIVDAVFAPQYYRIKCDGEDRLHFVHWGRISLA